MPKTKLKVNLSKTPNGESASKGKSKTKATKTAPPKTPDAEASKPLTKEEKLSKKEKEGERTSDFAPASARGEGR